MRKLRLVIVVVALALAPLVWASTTAPPAQPIHTYDRNGQDTKPTGKLLSVPVAEAHLGLNLLEIDDRSRHVQHLVRLYWAASNNYVHAECWAKNDGGDHDHWKMITACQLNLIPPMT